MSARRIVTVAGALAVAGCQAHARAQEDAATSPDAPASASDAPGAVDAPPSDAAPACTPTLTWNGLVIQIAGQPELVWSHVNKAEADNTTDARPTAYRTADGRAHLMLTHFQNYRVSGPSLGALDPTPQATFRSTDHELPAQADYSYRQWIMSPYTDDGTHFYALAHSEWYGCLAYPGDPVRGCTVGANQISSWVNGVVLFRSDDGGASWTPQGTGAQHVVLAPPAPYPGWAYWSAPSPLNFGMFHPSNIVKSGSHYDALVRYTHRTATGDVDAAGLVLMRTDDLSRPDSWKVWTSGDQFAPPVEPLTVLPGSGSWDHASISWNRALCRYLIVFFDYADSTVHVTSTTSLEAPQLEAPRVLAGQEYLLATPGTTAPGFIAANYANLLDPSWPGFNFEGSTAAPYLYFGSFDPSSPLVRDVYRAALALTNGPYQPVPLPAGLFMIGGGIYYANSGGAYCVFPDWATYVRITGRSDVVGVPHYGSIPSSMIDQGLCQG